MESPLRRGATVLDSTGPGASASVFGALEESPRGLRALYDRYCYRQAVALLSLVPRDAVRPLYRQALRWADKESQREDRDPLAILTAFCVELLPLPPFSVWLGSLRENPDPFLEDLEPVQEMDGSREAVTTDVRTFAREEGTWQARLRLFRDTDGWRGFISFRSDDGTCDVRTADVFRGDQARDIRQRFHSFQEDTLRAFLRSALP